MLKTCLIATAIQSSLTLDPSTTTCGAIKALYQSKANAAATSCCGLDSSATRSVDPACASVDFAAMTTDKLRIGTCFQLAAPDEAGKPPEIMPVCGEHKVFINGRILTMDATDSVVDAISVVGERVHAYGTNAAIAQYITNNTEVVDLRGSTMTPGHVEGHGHASYTAWIMGGALVNVQPPPLGTINNVDELVAKLKAEDERLVALGDTTTGIRGFGWSDTVFPHSRPLTTEDLDRVSTTRQIGVTHDSGHAVYLNTPGTIHGMNALNASSPVKFESTNTVEFWTDPNSGAVGTIGYYPQDHPTVALRGKPTGDFWESTQALAQSGTGAFALANPFGGLHDVSLKALSRGITMMDDSYAFMPKGWMRDNIKQKFAFKQEVVQLVNGNQRSDDFLPKRYRCGDKIVENKLKSLVDGSPQGNTAYLSYPHHTPPQYGPFAGDAEWRGFPSFTTDAWYNIVKPHHDNGWDIIVHSNGDGAIDIALDGLERLHNTTTKYPQRVEFVHCQIMRQDQIIRMVKLGGTCTFFNQHNYYYGDRHRDRFFGPERAANSSPLKWAVDAGMHFSTHADEPITSSEPMMRIRTAMTRLTRSGQVLGKHQRIGFMDAMKASTIWAAEQQGAEHCVGSLEPGKMFDAAIYDQDIMLMDPQEIYKAKVTRTYVNGEKLYDIDVNPSPFKRLRLVKDATDGEVANEVGRSAEILLAGMVHTSSPTPRTFEGKEDPYKGFPISNHPGNNL